MKLLTTKNLKWLSLFVIIAFYSCNNANHKEVPNSTVYEDQEENEEKDDDELEQNEDTYRYVSYSEDCELTDDTYDATVEYYNPSTGFRNTYSLEVEVENCEVTTIYFPKGGYLDQCHIYPAEIDEDGDATVKDEKGRIYYVHIDQ